MDHPVCQFPGMDALLLRRLLDLLPVLVGAGKKIDVIAANPLITGHDIGRDSRIGMADVGYVVDVVYRCRDVVVLHVVMFSVN